MNDRRSSARSWEGLRPELAPGVSIDAPLTEGAPWVIAVERVPRARVGEDFARLAGLFDGRRSLREAVVSAGVEAEAAQALGVMDALATAGLLRSGSTDAAVDTPPRAREGGRRQRAAGRRLRYRPPLTVQWEIFDPSALAAALARPLRVRGVIPVLCTAAVGAIALAGVSVVSEFDTIASCLMAPVPMTLLLPLVLAVIATGCVHELSHAVTLAAMGGRPNRMGIMVLLGMPAFFCDVTDGWRIGERWRRAAVALAGPALHLLLAAASFALLRVITAPVPRTFLILYGCACAAAVIANLIPFLKLDGYLALVAITDTPYLRANAVDAARRATARVLFGVDTRSGVSRNSPVLVTFGLCCIAFPLALFLWAALRLQSVFLGLGPWMASVYLGLVLTFLVTVTWRVGRFVVGCVRHRLRVVRTVVASGILAATVLFLLLIPMPATVHAGFMVRDGNVLLVASSTSTLGAVVEGAPVRLRANGVVLRPEVGTAIVGGEPSSAVAVEASMAAVAPATAPGVTVPAWGVRLREVVSSDSLPSAGAATVDIDSSRRLGVALVDLLVVEPLQAVFGAGAS